MGSERAGGPCLKWWTTRPALLLLVATCGVLVLPKLRFGGGIKVTPIDGVGPSTTPACQCDCKAQVAPSPGATTVSIDMFRFLGQSEFYGGVSFDVHRCGLPYPVLFPEFKDNHEALAPTWRGFAQELALRLSAVIGRDVQEADWEVAVSLLLAPDLQPKFYNEPKAQERYASDPRALEWQDALSEVLPRYLFTRDVAQPNSPVVALVKCPPNGLGQQPPPKVIGSVKDAGKPVCPSDTPAQYMRAVAGYHAVPHTSIKSIAKDAVLYGLCTKPPTMRHSYAHWLTTERMMKPAWKTFDVEALEQDAVVLLFDVLYEKLKVFKRQYWLGVLMMQNPLDMVAIADIIYTIKPDLIIETGTANGGSALVWASLLTLMGLHSSRVLTVDVRPPAWDASQEHWGGVPKEGAQDKDVWKRHVTFVKGSSTNSGVVARLKEEAGRAKTVLVILDANHERAHVLLEMRSLCPLVTKGSYCIVEDTKMSRWSGNGPLEGVLEFVRGNPGFEVDRSRELLYTHHASGYLVRRA